MSGTIRFMAHLRTVGFRKPLERSGTFNASRSTHISRAIPLQTQMNVRHLRCIALTVVISRVLAEKSGSGQLRIPSKAIQVSGNVFHIARPPMNSQGTLTPLLDDVLE